MNYTTHRHKHGTIPEGIECFPKKNKKSKCKTNNNNAYIVYEIIKGRAKHSPIDIDLNVLLQKPLTKDIPIVQYCMPQITLVLPREALD